MPISRFAAGLVSVPLLVALLLAPSSTLAQEGAAATLAVSVIAEDVPLPGATVRLLGGEPYVTDGTGLVELRVPAGSVDLLVQAPGFLDAELRVEARAGERIEVEVELQPAGVDDEVLVVASTRTGRRIEDQPPTWRSSGARRSRRS